MGVVRFFDAVDLKPAVEVTKEMKDFYANAVNQQNVQPLKVRIAATHSGKITRNNGFYLPHKMREGAPSFTKSYNKPVQVHHEEKSDPIGRIVAASYIDTSAGLRDSFDGKTWKDSTRSMTRVFDSFVKGTLSEREILDVAMKYFIQDNSLTDDPDYEGLGYIEVVALISDAAAIQKIIDGRYLTGSVGASTNQAVCSICKEDWADSGPCDHKPGKVYDEVRCVLIAGDLNYEEYSFVNKPADRHSKVIEVNVNGVKDFVQLDPQPEPEADKTSVPEILLVADRVKHVEEEHTMPVKDEAKAPEAITQDTAPVAAPVEPAKAPEPLPPEPPKEVTEIKDEIQVLKDFYGEEFDDVVGSEDPWGVEYAKMLYGLYEDAAEDQKEAVKKEIMDAKLKAAARNKLSEKTFCGPGRSYPVNDCTHARAAVRMAPHAGSGASAIAACARRKAARMGCPIGTGDGKAEKDAYDIKSAGKYDINYFDRFGNKKLLKMKLGLDAALKERALSCSTCSEMADSAKVKELEALLDETRKNKSTDLMDLEQLNRALADAAAEVRSAHVARITDLRLLKGEKVSVESVATELKDKTGSEIRGMLKDITEKVDIIKISDNINSGMANKPEVTTEVTVQDAEGKLVKGEPEAVAPSKIVDEQISKIVRLNYFNMKLHQGQEVADKYIEDCKAQGIVPSDWSIRG